MEDLTSQKGDKDGKNATPESPSRKAEGSHQNGLPKAAANHRHTCRSGGSSLDLTGQPPKGGGVGQEGQHSRGVCTTVLRGRYYYPHLADKETEA